MSRPIYFDKQDIPEHSLKYFEPAQCGKCYVCKMVKVFNEVKRVLKKEGTCWLNLGDSYNSHSTGQGNVGGIEGRRKNKHDNIANTYRQTTGLKDKDLVGIPWRVAFALQADDWYLRQDIIWHKVAPMPESVRDRPTRSHEQVFLLAKSERYFYNTEAARDPLKDNSIARLTQLNYEEQEGSERGNGGAKTNGKMKAVAAHFGGRNKSQINDQTRLASGNEWNQDPTAGANWR